MRRHVRQCEQCKKFKTNLKKTTHTMHAVYPASILVLFKNVITAKAVALFGGSGGAAAGGAAAS